MIRHYLSAALALAVGVGLGTSGRAAPSAEEGDIGALELQFAAAVSAKDVDGIMKVYDPDVFVFDVVPPRQYVGAAAYRKDWEAFLGAYKGPLKFQVTDLHATVEGPVAWSRSVQHIVGTDPAGQPSDTTVRVTDVYRKTPAGWRIVQEHVSVPVDPATGKADLQSKP